MKTFFKIVCAMFMFTSQAHAADVLGTVGTVYTANSLLNAVRGTINATICSSRAYQLCDQEAASNREAQRLLRELLAKASQCGIADLGDINGKWRAACQDYRRNFNPNDRPILVNCLKVVDALTPNICTPKHAAFCSKLSDIYSEIDRLIARMEAAGCDSNSGGPTP